MSEKAFEGWAIVELMGHRRLTGQVAEVQVAGAGFLRLDVPGDNGDVATQFYSPAAVYCITPTTEEMARKLASRPAPATKWELAPPIAATQHEELEDLAVAANLIEDMNRHFYEDDDDA